MSAYAALEAHVAALKNQSRYRQLTLNAGKDFSSNDYLGLSSSDILGKAAAVALQEGMPLGSSGSRLLRGNHAQHIMLEQEAAVHFGVEKSLFFANGYMANVALFSTLPQRGDLIIYDALIHASAHDGMRLGRAETRAAVHNDVQSFEDIYLDWRKSGGSGTVWLAVESLYSMDGDCAPLAELAALADTYGLILIIDEAHATGIYGQHGVGLAGGLEGRANVITLHTFGKALGCEGALICGAAPVMDMLINRARAFIYSTAPSPFMAAVARASLHHVAQNAELQTNLAQLVRHTETCLQRMGLRGTGSQIIPIIIGDAARAVGLATECQKHGFDVRAIRPPTVPQGFSRLRLCINLNITAQDVEALCDVFSRLL
jgi:8-amino-7-oxononanoate synthase